MERISVSKYQDKFILKGGMLGWLYAELLDQMGLEARFYRGDSKRQLQKEIENVRTVQKKEVVFVLDEAHLLGKETLEEFRFLLNYRFDSSSPMSLILVGQTELWDQKLRLQSYAAIRQRIDMNIVLNRLDRAETGKYMVRFVPDHEMVGGIE